MTEEAKALEARVIDLEMKIAHQDRLVEELNDIVTRQQDQIDQLSRRVARVSETIKASAGAGTAEGEEPPPPHY